MEFQGKPFKWIGNSFVVIERVIRETYPNIEVIVFIDREMKCFNIFGKLYLGKIYNVTSEGMRLFISLSADIRFYDMIDTLAKVIAMFISSDKYHLPLSRNAKLIYNNIKTKYKTISIAETQNVIEEVFRK